MPSMPSSGTITFDDLLTVFGGTDPVEISSYWRGGGKVPNTTQNAGVPTSGEISLEDFYGAGVTYAGSITAGQSTVGSVVTTGYVSGSIGSITGASVYGGTITEMASPTVSGTPGGVILKMSIGSNPTKSVFTYLLLNGETYASASATYTYSGGVATWTWTTPTPGLLDGPTYGWTFG